MSDNGTDSSTPEECLAQIVTLAMNMEHRENCASTRELCDCGRNAIIQAANRGLDQ